MSTFARIAEDFVLLSESASELSLPDLATTGKTVQEVKDNAMERIATDLPLRYDALNDELVKMRIGQVFITEYPDQLRRRRALSARG